MSKVTDERIIYFGKQGAFEITFENDAGLLDTRVIFNDEFSISSDDKSALLKDLKVLIEKYLIKRGS